MALIGAMSQQATNGFLNRTAVMKCAYFLQTLRQVPLGYNFTLYSYGPYDKDVLDDLDYAETLGIVEAERVEYRGGYGYKIRPGASVDKAKECAADFLSKYAAEIQSVLQEFGHRGSAELELASTIVYADREAESKSQQILDLTRRVREVKPHFTDQQIMAEAVRLQDSGYLRSTADAN